MIKLIESDGSTRSSISSNQKLFISKNLSNHFQFSEIARGVSGQMNLIAGISQTIKFKDLLRL